MGYKFVVKDRKIEDVYPGLDGLVGIVTLKKSVTNEIKRPIHKLNPLLVEAARSTTNKQGSSIEKFNQDTRSIILVALLFLANRNLSK